MKRLLFIAVAVFIITACISGCSNTAEKVGPQPFDFRNIYDSFESVCKSSNVIVKAKYLSSSDFTDESSIFAFRLDTDFIGNLNEELLHVRESSDSSFIPGKIYYLFLLGRTLPFFPYPIYMRICPDFLPGQTGALLGPKYSFYGDNTLGLDEITDLSAYIQDEIIQAEAYNRRDINDYSTDLQNAFFECDAALHVTVTEVAARDAYFADCTYRINEVLKIAYKVPTFSIDEYSDTLANEYAEGIRSALHPEDNSVVRTAPLPAPTQVGDEFYLLFNFIPANKTVDLLRSVYMGSYQYPVDSETNIHLSFALKNEPDITIERTYASDGFTLVTFDDLQTICDWTDTIVKAKYIGYESFDSHLNVYKFTVEKDFTNNVDETVVHIIDKRASSFITGKSYYLFLQSFRSCLLPFVDYGCAYPPFLIGEIETDNGLEYTFHRNLSFGLDGVKDMSEYIETEIVKKGKYMSMSREYYYPKESAQSAYQNADAVLLVTVTGVDRELSSNKYTATAYYTINRLIKGTFKDPFLPSYNAGAKAQGLTGDNGVLRSTPAPSTTRVGDRLILLFENATHSIYSTMYSPENVLIRQ